MSAVVRGLRANVYRSVGEFSNGGISARVSRVTVIGTEIDAAGGAIFEPTDDAPAVILVSRKLHDGAVHVHAEPLDLVNRRVWPMAGGTYIASSDSRFAEATGVSYPIALHDRVES